MVNVGTIAASLGGSAAQAVWLGPKGRRPLSALAIFIRWTGWTHAVVVPWWLHHKRSRLLLLLLL